MPIKRYSDLHDNSTNIQIIPIVSYIEKYYKDAVFDEKYSEKTYIPTWRLGGTYVAIGCKKNYISIYFGSALAIQTVKENIDSSQVKVRAGCINISYKNKNFPYEAIYKGIDVCFK